MVVNEDGGGGGFKVWVLVQLENARPTRNTTTHNSSETVQRGRELDRQGDYPQQRPYEAVPPSQKPGDALTWCLPRGGGPRSLGCVTALLVSERTERALPEGPSSRQNHAHCTTMKKISTSPRSVVKTCAGHSFRVWRLVVRWRW